MPNPKELIPHSALCAFYVFQQTEPCDCEGGGPDDPKTQRLRVGRLTAALRKISEKDDYGTVVAGSIADRALAGGGDVAVGWEIEEARARVVEAAKAYVATLRPDGGLDIGGIYAAVADLERLESAAVTIARRHQDAACNRRCRPA